MKDLKLDKLTHDIEFVDPDLEIIDGLDYLEQKIKIVLLFFFAEWFLDVTVGLKYWELIFIKNPNLTIIDSMYKRAILEINGVQELLTYDSSIDTLQRLFGLTFSVKTDWGELNLTQEISP